MATKNSKILGNNPFKYRSKHKNQRTTRQNTPIESAADYSDSTLNFERKAYTIKQTNNRRSDARQSDENKNVNPIRYTTYDPYTTINHSKKMTSNSELLSLGTTPQTTIHFVSVADSCFARAMENVPTIPRNHKSMIEFHNYPFAPLM